MSVQIVGASGVVPEVESTSKALRVVPHSRDVLLGGAYSVVAITGIMAAGITGASEILQFRWLSTTHKARIERVRICAAALGTAFAAGNAQFDLTIARGWSAVGTGGGVVAATTNNFKRKTSMLSSQMAVAAEANGSIRVATTAALGAGTKTLDAAPVRSMRSYVPNTAYIGLTPGDDGLLWEVAPGQHAIELVANEGFVVRTTVPATGTWSADIAIDWEELPI